MQVYQIWWNNANYAVKGPLHRSKSFKVTDFGTNRKLICDFLLVINSNLPPISHCFQVKVHFSLVREECLTLMLTLWVIPCRYHHKRYITKTTFFDLHFCRRKYRCLFNHFYVISLESYRSRWNYAVVRLLRRSRSPSLVPIESSYATSY